MVGKTDLAEIANKFGKPDMERLGLFIEMPYMNGKGYVSPFPSKTRNCSKTHRFFTSEF